MTTTTAVITTTTTTINMVSVPKGLVLVTSLSRALTRCSYPASVTALSQTFHTSTASPDDHDDFSGPKFRSKMTPPTKFLTYNDVVYPPIKEGEEPRPAEYCHVKKIAGSPKKFWFAAVMVRGLSIDEAIRQCEFSKKACPKIVRDVLLEAQKSMIEECNVEFAPNMWIADSYVTTGGCYRSLRRQFRRGVVRIKHPISNYFVRLREGQPPEHYYAPEQSGYEKLEDYIKEQRQRKIRQSL